MKLHKKIELLKFCSMVLNFILVALGVSVAGCGLWILFDSGFISVVSLVELQLVAVALLAVGGVVLVVSVLAMVGVQRESRVLLLPVAVLLLLLVLPQLFITFLLVASKAKIHDAVGNTVDKLIKLYPEEERLLVDDLQHYGECCGRTNRSDWLSNQFVQSLDQSEAEVLPCSCFDAKHYEPGAFCSRNLTINSDVILYGNNSFNESCDEKISLWLDENLFTIVGMDLGLVLIQILQLAIVVTLYQSFGAKASVKSSDSTLTDPDLRGEQVYSDADLLHQDQDSDQGLYHGPYDGPYGETYGDPNPDYSQYRD